jgi:hypothetical protein
MKRLLPLFCILVILFASAGVAFADKSQPGDFSTTGYTTNLFPTPVAQDSLPTEFDFLAIPSYPYAKFHIKAQGGPAVDNDALCRDIYGLSCADLCGSVVKPPPSCGATGYFDGSFTFDEWAVVDLTTNSGANHGLLSITTSDGMAKTRFGGNASSAGVSGSFTFLKGSGDYHNLKGEGTYAGIGAFVFKVDYQSCGAEGNPECPVNRCAVFGDDLKIQNDKTGWRIANEGQKTITLNTLFVYWPSQNGALEKVKLGGETLWSGSQLGPAFEFNLTADVKDREIKAGKSGELTLEFADKKISKEPSDYTILAKFALANSSEGCAVPFAAFKDVP